MLNRKGLRPAWAIALVALVAVLLTGTLTAPAQAAPALDLEARSAVLLDFATGQVLYEKNPDEPIAPASLTKLMTLHLAFKRIEAGQMSYDDPVVVSRNAWAANFPDSSLMFLEPGDKVTVGEVMKGLAIVSGNDAAVALAEHIGGTVENFVKMMNDEAQALGFKTFRFVDPHGLSPQNQVTAGEFARFARLYIQLHPESLEMLHSQKEYSYPQYENLSDARQAVTSPKAHEPITQMNRNGLLWTYEGVDGLKTGFVDEAGFNLAVTAQRGGMRLVGVLLGIQADSIPEGSAKREAEGAALLSWGFSNFVTVKPQMPEVKPVRVWKGAANEVTLQAAGGTPTLVLEKGLESSLTASVRQEESVTAPVAKGQKLGEVIFAADGQEVARLDLVAAEDVPQGGFFKRIWDSLKLWIHGFFNR
ncbi:D-alanyl-D-alanine carboxypeptidase family protein [Symbiobacterium thermophilum]|uniref:serine-type D-Ala-D-Ala carboxypeptidase n=1 Tax=Symbiobacterium thermophilum TaxID=2734 RepID=A0A953I7P6_SYMTR|nr:D-alanyl-D-alanine carboxypeptidase family protein [Symbiobacterium thermophilum]MBY6275853.1 D-alanyl-D-alanine carboxypeptidase [Symbiobacterium thermophilum]